MRRHTVYRALLLPLVPALLQADRPTSVDRSGEILVGPNVRATVDGDFPHAEPHIAVNPRDPRHLLIASQNFSEAGWAPRTYVSFDGGYSWKVSAPPAQE